MREKLIELIIKGPAEYSVGADGIADYLIANGVTMLPCKIGDTVWAIGKQYGRPYISQGVVSEMTYLEDMRLGIVVKFSARYSTRGFWGVTIFATREECVAEVERRAEKC